MTHIDQRPEVVKMWDAYWADPTPETRNALVIAYWPLCQRVARSVARSVHDHDPKELAQLGFFGLIDAIEKFNPQEASFATYARQRIRGSIIDRLRVESPLKRSQVAAARKAGLPLPFPLSLDREVIDHDPDGPATLGETVAATGPSVTDQVEISEYFGTLISAVDSLSLPDQAVLCAKYIDRLSAAELAEFLGLSINRARIRHMDALQHLHDDLVAA